MKKKDDDKEETIRLACVGLGRAQGSKKLLHVWTRVIDGKLSSDPDEQRCIWEKLTGRVGFVYDVIAVTWTKDSKVVHCANPKYVGAWPEAEDRLAWEAQAGALKTAHEAERVQKNEEKHSALREALAPIRDLYRGMLPDQRRGLLALVMTEIMGAGAPPLRRD